MEGRNEQYRKANPIADIHRVATREDGAWAQLEAWEKSYQDFRFVMGEKIYERERRKKMIELGLAEPSKEKATR